MRLAIFDLDYTVWQPEMYQLYSAPKLTPISRVKSKLSNNPRVRQEARTRTADTVLMDRSGSIMRVFDGASYALRDIQRLREEHGHDIRAAVASKTDEPQWARICLDHLVLSDGDDDKNSNNNNNTLLLADCFENRLIEIYYGSKVQHIRNLHQKTGVPFADMCFFDNEHWNVKDVSRQLPDVKCFYTPHGMTRQAWEEAKGKFGNLFQ